MATSTKGARRTIVDALDDLAAELRLANRLHALRLGAAQLDDEANTSANVQTRRRIDRRNRLRAEIRAGLGEVDDA